MDRLLLHLFQHQIHHRGQAHAMLKAAPPSVHHNLTSFSQKARHLFALKTFLNLGGLSHPWRR